MKALALAVLLSSGIALADEPPKTQADRLFDEGVALRNKGQTKEACAKFEEAMKHDERAIGTLLNLALCAEKFDHYATAVHLYSEARDRAKEQGLHEHEKAAEEHIAALAPQVSHVTITLAETLPGTKILVDDKVIATSELTKLPIDAGTRTLNVSAPGRLPYATTLTIEIGKESAVAVPALAKSLNVKVVSSRRSIGKIVTLGGGVLVGAGVGLGLWGRSTYNAQFAGASPACTPDGTLGGTKCTSDGQKQTEKARTVGNVGTAIGIAGIAAIGVGVALWLTAPHAETATGAGVAIAGRAVMIVPVGGPDEVGLAALGRF